MKKVARCQLINVEYIPSSESRTDMFDSIKEPYQKNGQIIIPEENGWARIIKPAKYIVHVDYEGKDTGINIADYIVEQWGELSYDRAEKLSNAIPPILTIEVKPNGLKIAQTTLQLWLIQTEISETTERLSE